MAALGCGKGYPTEDVVPPSAAERVAQLNALLGTQQSDALRIALVDVCHLSVRWKGRSTTDVYPLRDIRVPVDTDESGLFLVRIERLGDAAQLPLLLSTPKWVQMTGIRGDLDQLRADCINSPQGRE